MATGILNRLPHTHADERTRRPDYELRGKGVAGGAYNGHVAFLAVLVALSAARWFDWWLLAWIGASFAAAILLDQRSWRRKVNISALPSQCVLYAQVFIQAAWDALPAYVWAFVLYICSAPLVAPMNLPVSSFVLLYAFFLVVRTCYVSYYLWRLRFCWSNAGRTFARHEANLKSSSSAVSHVLWAYCLGNVGLVVRCGVQVTTIGGLEWLRQRCSLDLTQLPISHAQLLLILAGAVAAWLVTFWWAIRRALLIYYRTHRTFHDNPALYSSIHGIHHRGVLPTPLDSGTISPAEFWITEMSLPSACLVPNWWFALGQIALAIIGHWPSHDSGTRLTISQHHLLHHRHLRVNLGLTPAEDAEFGTLLKG